MEKGGVILTHPPQLDMGLLLHNLTLRLKVRQAAILDLHGNVVHMTPDFSLPPDDCASLQRVLHAAPTAGMWRLSLLGHHFRCFHCTGDATVLGYSATTVMAAHVTRRHLVLGLAPEDVPGSCLHEMMQVWDQIEAQGM
ncbi:hypothetical protein ACOMHN_030470 [Nucella lapillus]